MDPMDILCLTGDANLGPSRFFFKLLKISSKIDLFLIPSLYLKILSDYIDERHIDSLSVRFIWVAEKNDKYLIR